MQNVEIQETIDGTVVTIDGVKFEGIYSVIIKKNSDSPIEIELSGSITKQVLVGF